MYSIILADLAKIQISSDWDASALYVCK